MGNLTFTMIKPDAVRANNHAKILQHLVDAGFRIVALRMWIQRSFVMYAERKCTICRIKRKETKDPKTPVAGKNGLLSGYVRWFW